MREELRMMGIKLGLNGTGIMEKMLRGEVSTKDLTDKQVQEVLSAWETRYIVPESMIGKVDVVAPAITEDDVNEGRYSQKERDRNYVEMIEKYLQVGFLNTKHREKR